MKKKAQIKNTIQQFLLQQIDSKQSLQLKAGTATDDLWKWR